MSIIEKIFAIKIEHYMKTHDRYTFPEFMRIIRHGLGLSRQMVADLNGCFVTKIKYLEDGKYGCRGPEIEFIISIADFYGLDPKFVMKKFDKYIKTHKEKKASNKKNENGYVCPEPKKSYKKKVKVSSIEKGEPVGYDEIVDFMLEKKGDDL